MKKIVMTKEMIQAYYERMKDRKFNPNYPFCRICMHADYLLNKQSKNQLNERHK